MAQPRGRGYANPAVISLCFIMLSFCSAQPADEDGVVDKSALSSVWAAIREDLDAVCEPSSEEVDTIVRDLVLFLLAFAPQHIVQVGLEDRMLTCAIRLVSNIHRAHLDKLPAGLVSFTDMRCGGAEKELEFVEGLRSDLHVNMCEEQCSDRHVDMLVLDAAHGQELSAALAAWSSFLTPRAAVAVLGGDIQGTVDQASVLLRGAGDPWQISRGSDERAVFLIRDSLLDPAAVARSPDGGVLCWGCVAEEVVRDRGLGLQSSGWRWDVLALYINLEEGDARDEAMQNAAEGMSVAPRV